MQRERKLRAQAMTLVLKIADENKLQLARRARALMQESLANRREAAQLYARYKKALLRKGTDDRLDPGKSIEYGLKYFARMMRMQKGDISLALASYNAGPHRVKKYGGIPPFPETVSFRNRILAYYREYLRRLNRIQTGCQWAR
jgi:soluble lytic murein transglycosylase-like protein